MHVLCVCMYTYILIHTYLIFSRSDYKFNTGESPMEIQVTFINLMPKHRSFNIKTNWMPQNKI